VIGAIVIQLTGFNKADIIASLIVAIMIVAMSVRLVFDSVHILLEGTPREFDPDQIQKDIKSQFSQILDIHDFHIWEITSHLPAMTAHIEAKIESLTESQKLIEEINVMLKKNYGIRHTTFQIEARG
jgi:cobalt-zinc-cadmium efflux system protein